MNYLLIYRHSWYGDQENVEEDRAENKILWTYRGGREREREIYFFFLTLSSNWPEAGRRGTEGGGGNQ